ncbi:LCP family protein [Weissella sagaensis]|uniref:LCP family protein n=1 Tax=Weissella sagaensis TaxID=2559928 RepID=A0ABW1RR95_9LACO|nr:LCP family protein [Weissella sagaensis]QDJ58039.1 LytR family transcriptional regulator [Weissella hellenica]QEA57038.1 LytR family transcriptional regulator [Weissella hellenica]
MDNEPKTRLDRRQAENELKRRKKREGGPRDKKFQSNGKQPRKRRIRGAILFVIAVIVLIVGMLFGVAYNKTKNAIDGSYQETGLTKERNVSKVIKQGKPFSILLLGTDTGELDRKYKGRTDSLMLVTVNPDKEKVTIMSLPRDSVIAPVGYEEEFPQKLNSAYEYGSAKTTIQTIQKWLNVPIDYYALVNMGGLEKVIDQMNGIKVKSPLTFGYNPYTAHNDGDYIYNFTKGSSTFTLNAKGQTKTYKKMDGQAALAFSRMRYDDPQGDYGRQKRQRMVLQTIVDDAKSNPTKLINQKFLNTLSDSTQTDLTFGDMLTVASRYLSAAKTIKQDNAQGTEVNLTSGSSELISQDEKQRVTNVLRKSLGLKHKKTGTLYGGKVSNATLIMNGLPASQSATEEAADTTTDSTYGTGTVTDTDTYVGY